MSATSVEFRMVFPAKSIHLIFSTVTCCREPVFKLQPKHRPKFLSLPSEREFLVLQNDVVFLVRIPGCKDVWFPGLLNDLNLGFLQTFGVFKGLASNSSRIPFPEIKAVSLSTLPFGYSYTMNYTKFVILSGTPLVMGEPDLNRVGEPIVKNQSGHKHRVVACLRPWDVADPSGNHNTKVTYPKVFSLLDGVFEVWPLAGPDHLRPPTMGGLAAFLFKRSASQRFPEITEDVFREYYRFKGSVPLRVKRELRQYYPVDLDIEDPQMPVMAHPLTKEPVVMILVNDELAVVNSVSYWANLFTFHIISSYPLGRVFDETNPLGPVEQEQLGQRVEASMNLMSLYAIQMDMGTRSLLSAAEIGARLKALNQPLLQPAQFPAAIPYSAPLCRVCALSRSWRSAPGQPITVTLFY